MIEDSIPRFGIVGVTVLFAFAGANALASTGLPEQLTTVLNQLSLPVWLLALVIGLIVIAVAAPLSSTATMAAVGTVGVAALVAAGVPARPPRWPCWYSPPAKQLFRPEALPSTLPAASPGSTHTAPSAG